MEWIALCNPTPLHPDEISLATYRAHPTFGLGLTGAISILPIILFRGLQDGISGLRDLPAAGLRAD